MPDSPAEAMMVFTEQIAPLREWGIGLRTTLLADGWAPESAESIAAATLSAVLVKVVSS